MNYRHAFHAGNFADVMKHLILVRVLVHLRRKETPFRVIDTHAGIGLYDLAGDEAERTGEWRDGVGRLEAPFSRDVEALIAPYREVLAMVRSRSGHVYPGSPMILRELLRRQDRGVLVELHPEDGDRLAAEARSPRLKVLKLDGWVALHALIPPKERRGVVLIDPPYETPGELDRLAVELAKALRKWPTGVFIGWYPIKDPQEVEPVAEALRRAAPDKGLRLELMVERPDGAGRLSGCGLFILNPPWTLKSEATAILPALAERLARRGYGAYRCEPLGKHSRD